MTPAYARRYTIPGLPGEASGVELSEAVPEGYLPVVWAQGPVVLVPVAALTEVDTTPDEPEPGAWLIGETVCVRWEGDDSERHWATTVGRVFGWWDWAAAWAEFSGPGITPRRLVPEPAPVQLPYALYDITVEARENGGVWLAVDEEGTYCSPEAAECHGWALISAARAAREVTP